MKTPIKEYQIKGKRKKPQALDFDYLKSSLEVVFEKLKTSEKGLALDEAQKRLGEYGYNQPVEKKERPIPAQILLRFLNPLVMVLLIIATFSLFFGEKVSALLVLLMAILSVFLSFFQEYRASREAEKLMELVHTTATVLRGGKIREIKLKELVPGDIVDLSGGDMVPADLRVIHSKDLFVNQSSLTGESLPVEISEGMVFMGSSVVSGTALGVAVKTGSYTKFGELSRQIEAIYPETSFDRGIRDFTLLMVRAMFAMVIFIFTVNALLRGNFLEAFLFSLAVAVGLTPEMLPMLVTVNLSAGAMEMAKKEVIVKRLSSIQNFGAMDVLCTDKTGTLTLDKIVLEKHCNVKGKEDQQVLALAYINSYYQSGLKNLLDKAILKHEKLVAKPYQKIDEVPFDFERRLMSVVIEHNSHHRLISKGAPEEIFKRCTKFELEGKVLGLHPDILKEVEKEYAVLSAEGFRVLALAYKDIEKHKEAYSKDDERDMVLRGYLAFLDPPKPTAREAVEDLKKLGVAIKILTGDNELVTKKICQEIHVSFQGLVLGEQVDKLTDQELQAVARENNMFVRLSPLQKDRIIRALQNSGHTVGFLGDGINDGAALKSSDVGISVNNAADIAKETADIILLRKSLRVLRDAVVEGRKTFGNIIKYVKMGSSSNFGNMLSMTGASLFLPFLPMLPIQILLNNFLYDLSQVAIPTDAVDREYLAQPRPWNIGAIQKYMLLIGPVSSVFDFTTFGVLLFVFHASPPFFHTGWFLESLVTQTLVIHIIRTNKIPFIESKPSAFLVLTSLFIVAAGAILPFSPLAKYFGLVVPPASYFGALLIIVPSYLILVQIVKSWFIKKFGYN